MLSINKIKSKLRESYTPARYFKESFLMVKNDKRGLHDYLHKIFKRRTKDYICSKF